MEDQSGGGAPSDETTDLIMTQACLEGIYVVRDQRNYKSEHYITVKHVKNTSDQDNIYAMFGQERPSNGPFTTFK